MILSPLVLAVVIALLTGYFFPEKIVFVILTLWIIFLLIISIFCHDKYCWLLAICFPLLIIILFCFGDLKLRL